MNLFTEDMKDPLTENKPIINLDFMQFFDGYFAGIRSYQKMIVPMGNIIHAHIRDHGGNGGRIILVAKECLYIWEEITGNDIAYAALTYERNLKKL